MRRVRAATIAVLLVCLAFLAWWLTRSVPEPHVVVAPVAEPAAPAVPAPEQQDKVPDEVEDLAEGAAEQLDPAIEAVLCPLPAGIGDVPYEITGSTVTDEGGGITRTREVTTTSQIEGGELWMPNALFTNHDNQAFVTIEGFLPARAVVDDGVCTLEAPEPAAQITGTVSGPLFDAEYASVSSCGTTTHIDAEHRTYTVYVPPDVDCFVQASRTDGSQSSRSASVKVVPHSGVPTVVNLALPHTQMGGLGIRLHAEDDGLHLSAVRRDGSAHLAGLVPGDHLMSIDGRDAREMSEAEATALLSGAAGDEVELVVQRPEGPQTLTLSLAVVPSEYSWVETVDGGHSVRDDEAWIEE